MSEFDETFDAMCETARHVLLVQGQHGPQLVLGTDTELIVAALVGMPEDFEERHREVGVAVRQLRRKARARTLRSAFFICEAWIALVTAEELERGNWRPRDNPNRKEVISVVGRDVEGNGQLRLWHAELIRLGKRVIEVVPLPVPPEPKPESAMLDAIEAGWGK